MYCNVQHDIKSCGTNVWAFIGGRGDKSGRGIENFAHTPIHYPHPPHLNPAYAPGVGMPPYRWLIILITEA